MVHRAVRVFAAAAVGAVGLTLWATWPMAAHLATRVYDPSAHRGFLAASIRADIRLVMWILAWDVHALATAPARLLDANVFHPAPATLALSEHLFGALPLYAPLAAATGDPVLAHQATLLATFVGAFLAAFALVYAWTRAWAAATLAASLFAFSPFRGGHLGALQIEGCWLLPLVVLAAWRTAARAGGAWPLALGATLALAGLQSVYVAYAAFVGVATLGGVAMVLDATTRRAWRRLAIPTALAALVVAASAVPSLVAHARGAIPPPAPGFVASASATLAQTGSGAALVLALATVPWWRRGVVGVPGGWLIALAATAATAHALALGPLVAGRVPGPYAALAAIVPGFAALRIPLRFDAVTTACLAALAGVGAAGVARALPARARHAADALLVLAAVTAARLGLPHPVPLEPIETRATLPPIYAALATAPGGPLVELPWHDFRFAAGERGVDAERVYRSVYHWRPLLNGYSGYAPPGYGLVSALVEALPDPRALGLLARTTGLRLVLLHRGEVAPGERARWDAEPPGLDPVARAGDDVLFAVHAPPPADLLPALRAAGAAAPPAATPTGTALVDLPDDGRRAALRLLGRAAPPHAPVTVAVEVTNASARRWPALTLADAHRVAIAARWDDGPPLPAAGRLPWDLGPGESARAVASVRPPDAPGAHTLVLGVAQDGAWFAGDTLSIPIEVR
jgi:hypothetical protein